MLRILKFFSRNIEKKFVKTKNTIIFVLCFDLIYNCNHFDTNFL
jgi:hypothetical protein